MQPDRPIRRHRTEENRVVGEIWHRSGQAAYPFIPTWQRFPLEHAQRVFAEQIVPACEVWVATEAERPVGYLALEGNEIDRLYVDPIWQGRGVGSALLDHAKQLHPDHLELVTHRENRGARVFYERHGFEPIAFGVSPPPESVPDLRYRWARREALIPAEVTRLLDHLGDALDALFGEELLGLYLRGSLATGDFLPETSDVDVFAAVEHAVDDATFARLEVLHEQVAAASPSHGHRLEITYVHRAALRSFTPGLRHATLGQGERLAWHTHGSQWRIERAVVQACGIPLRGPAAKTWIDPIDPATLVESVRERLQEWVLWAAEYPEPERNHPNRHKAYVVESLCRALHALATGNLASKPRAVAWALDAIPEPWVDTVERSQVWRTDPSVQPELTAEVQAFVAWAGEHAEKLERPVS